jgi:hypothetical protein
MIMTAKSRLSVVTPSQIIQTWVEQDDPELRFFNRQQGHTHDEDTRFRFENNDTICEVVSAREEQKVSIE